MEEDLLKARNGCHSVERLRLVITPRIPAGYPKHVEERNHIPTDRRALSVPYCSHSRADSVLVYPGSTALVVQLRFGNELALATEVTETFRR